MAAIVLGVVVGLGSCGEGSSGGRGPSLVPPLSVYVEKPDLETQLRDIEAETGAAGLTLSREVRGKLPRGGGPVVVRAYTGRDTLGRKTHAVRVATSRGVVMAVGPLATMGARDGATEFVVALVAGASGDVEEGAFQSGTDLNGDGSPDVVVRNEAGVMEVWGVSAVGASPYLIEMEVAPTRAFDVDEDGTIDFAGEVGAPPGDGIGARLEDVAVFEEGRYLNRAAGARRWHARRAAALRAAARAGTGANAGTGTGADAGTGTGTDAGAAAPAPVPDEVRLRRALELAWHLILSGSSREEAFKELDKEAAPARLREAFEHYRSRIVKIARRTSSTRSTPPQ